MSAKDAFHEIVKSALQKDGWLITHDPYPLQAAEKVIAAEREGVKIAQDLRRCHN